MFHSVTSCFCQRLEVRKKSVSATLAIELDVFTNNQTTKINRRLTTMKKINMKKFLKDSKGASMVEYALLLFAVLLCAAAAIKLIGPAVSKAGNQSATAVAP